MSKTVRTYMTFSLMALIISAFTLGCSRNESAKSVVEDVAQALGADKLKTIQYSTTKGTWYWNGQSYEPKIDSPWPKFTLVSYMRVLDYEKGASQEKLVRTESAEDFKKPQRGGGLTPIKGTAARNSFLSGDTAWEVSPMDKPGPAGGIISGGNFLIPAVDERQVQMAITPHGWAKAAMAASNPTMELKDENGKQLKVISFTFKNKYKITAFINDQNLVEKVQTWFPETVAGDQLIEAKYSDYKDFSGVKFPMTIVQEQGGRPVLALTVEEVTPNAPVNIEVPPAEQLTRNPPRVTSEKLFDGVWALRGIGTQSILVEFGDYLLLGEAGGNDDRSTALIEEAKKLVPNKPIKYVIHNHHHHDHSGGLRAFVAEGATIIMYENAVPYYQELWAHPRTLMPDRLSQNPKPFMSIPVKDKYVLSDGTRSVEFYHLSNNPLHATSQVVTYLPKEKLLFTGDMGNPYEYAPAPPPNEPLELIGLIGVKEWLFQELDRRKLDVQHFMNPHVPDLKTPAQQRNAIKFEKEKIQRFDKEHPNGIL